MPKPRHLLPGLIAAIAAFFLLTPAALAFCGFYVAKADTSLYNQASQVAIARDGDRTILTMANDYQGDVEDFALVVPVPTVITEGQVNVADGTIMERLDAFSAPRLVEYFDADPCAPVPPPRPLDLRTLATPSPEAAAAGGAAALGVTVEAQYTVGEYDILILSAQESDGLETWLRQNGYRLPDQASELLQPYIRQGMKFFVAKVNLEEFDQSGFQQLRPLQIAYESPRFMLPIRLGMMNAEDAQDLVVYLLSPSGQTELTNYRTVKIPSDMDIPVFVKDEFADFYTSMFDTSHDRENREVAFLEYAWDMRGCDPCSADPLTYDELRKAGVFWITPQTGNNVFVTRLHVRYTRDKFPEDLMFQETNNRQFFQGRYVMRHPFGGDLDCPAGQEYRRRLPQRFEAEAQTLARLTGWDINDIRRKLPTVDDAPEPAPWWEDLWGHSGQLWNQVLPWG
ncbi:MAG: DUF2330 domain-containing protein [Cyanobacteria bacterium]|nr:DUF2330 domain-containing protein [Cyanobacteriota bacterium]